MPVVLLTRRQQEIFDQALEEGSYTALNGNDRDVCKNLVQKGRFFLADHSKKEWVFKVTSKYRDKMSRKARGIEEPQRPVIPDPDKPAIDRPPAEYSNCISGNALIDKILNNTADGK